VTIPSQGCAIRDFDMQVDNTISGRVWDHHGRPVLVSVSLIDLDQPTRMRTAYTEKAGQFFRFDNVPAGRYLLLSNSDGPGDGQHHDNLPFERT